MRDAPPQEVLASWVSEELVRDADDAGAEFWYCSYCDGANGATRETVSHVASCPVGAAVAVLADVRAAAPAPSGVDIQDACRFHVYTITEVCLDCRDVQRARLEAPKP